MKTCFTDVESTGLRDRPGAVAWEFGVIARESHDIGGGLEAVSLNDREYLWWVRPDLSLADPAALRINRYYERTAGCRDSATAVNLAELEEDDEFVFSDPRAVAEQLAPLLADSVLVGQNPWFDADLTDEFLRRNGQVLAADFHLRDVSSMVTGYLCAVGLSTGALGGGDPLDGSRLKPPSLRAIAVRLGIDLEPYDLHMHTALGDTRLARDVHDIIAVPYLTELRKFETLPSLN